MLACCVPWLKTISPIDVIAGYRPRSIVGRALAAGLPIEEIREFDVSFAGATLDV